MDHQTRRLPPPRQNSPAPLAPLSLEHVDLIFLHRNTEKRKDVAGAKRCEKTEQSNWRLVKNVKTLELDLQNRAVHEDPHAWAHLLLSLSDAVSKF